MWFDVPQGGVPCEETAEAWYGQAWHQCFHDSGLPYPGSERVQVRNDAFYISKMENRGNKNVPPPVDGSKCYFYFDESKSGFCALFQGGRPGNMWFDGSSGDDTCEERAEWWYGMAW